MFREVAADRAKVVRVLAVPLLAVLMYLIPSVCEAAVEPSEKDLTELSIQELMEVEVATVYGASKFEQKVTEAPASVSIVTADEIKKFGYRNLADIIASQRGFFTTYDRNYAYVGARGVDRSGGYNTRILVLVDGHRTNENMYDTAFIGNEFVVDTDLIERIEIIRGPGSSLYGDNAFFGVLNIITRHNASLEGLEASGEGGSYDTYKGRLSYGKKFKQGALSLSGTVFDSRGKADLFYPAFNDPATNNGIAHNGDYERAHSFFGTLSLRDFTLQGAYSSRTKGVPTAAFGAVFNDSRFHTVDNRGYLDLKYDHTFQSGWETMARLFYDSYYYYENVPFDSSVAGDPPVLNRDSALNRWWGAELKGAKSFQQGHLLVAGIDFQDTLVQKFDNYDIQPFHEYQKIDRPIWRWASYLQDEYTISPKVILNAGLRYDYYSTFGSTVNPRAALIFSPVPATRLKAIYGEAFRAPNSYELYYGVPEFLQKGNPALHPEKIRTGELIWEEVLSRHFRSTVGLFYSKISAMITQQTDTDGTAVFLNTAGVTSKGAEAELEGRWLDGLLTRVSYTYQDARDEQSGATLVDSPKHMAKLNVIVPLVPEKLFSGIEMQYLSKRQTFGGKFAGGFVKTNLTLFSHKLVKGLELSATVYNLFDKRYGDPGSLEHRQDVIEQDGRIFRAKLTYTF